MKAFMVFFILAASGLSSNLDAKTKGIDLTTMPLEKAFNLVRDNEVKDNNFKALEIQKALSDDKDGNMSFLTNKGVLVIFQD